MKKYQESVRLRAKIRDFTRKTGYTGELPYSDILLSEIVCEGVAGRTDIDENIRYTKPLYKLNLKKGDWIEFTACLKERTKYAGKPHFLLNCISPAKLITTNTSTDQ